jgi:thymidylate synthase (FAD)
MEVVEQNWEIKEWPHDAVKVIEDVGRDAYKSHDRVKPGSADKFCNMLIEKGHEAVLEFADIRIRVLTNRAVSHEMVRHRHASFLQESQRYVNYKGGMQFIRPYWADKSPDAFAMWVDACRQAETNYTYMIEALGMKPQEARDILPNATATIINMKHNIRGWREVLALRTSPAAYPAIREIMSSLLVEFHNRLPVLFQDLYDNLSSEYKN